MQRKNALITGASRGIGRAIAQRFAENGYDLILTCSRQIDQLQAFADYLTEHYSISCIASATDMGCEEDVAALFTGISSLDVLVNNAGISHIGLLSDMTAEQWHRMFAVNLDSCFYPCRAAIPLMLHRQDHQHLLCLGRPGCLHGGCLQRRKRRYECFHEGTG